MIAGSVLGVGALIAPATAATPAAAPVGTPAGASAPAGAGAGTVGTEFGPATKQPTARTSHCAVSLAPVGDSAANEVEQHCFERFSDAVAYGTDGDVRLPRDAGPRALDLDSKAATASALLGVLYDGTAYDGASKVLNGTGRGCYAGRTYAVNNLDDVGFEDRASSFKVRSNCLGRVYAGRNQEGANYLCEHNCRSLGNMSNRTSSVKFF